MKCGRTTIGRKAICNLTHYLVSWLSRLYGSCNGGSTGLYLVLLRKEQQIGCHDREADNGRCMACASESSTGFT
jgi:hypothetical protein